MNYTVKSNGNQQHGRNAILAAEALMFSYYDVDKAINQESGRRTLKYHADYEAALEVCFFQRATESLDFDFTTMNCLILLRV